RRHTRFSRDWSSDVCSSDLLAATILAPGAQTALRAGDVLYVDLRPSGQRIETLLQECGLQEVPLKDNRFSDRSQAIGMAELLIPATSRPIGEPVISSRFRPICPLSDIA